jgi:GH25 family lysozyme M1 (1,4-beta-N-acetylmuramidase)
MESDCPHDTDPPPSPAEPAPPPPITVVGDKGPAVEAWQLRVIADGYPLPVYGADGNKPRGGHGAETEQATVGWLADRDLERDGKGGTRTAAVVVTGIDISHHQTPARFDWPRVGSDHAFVIARACYGARIDGTFVEHVAGARAAGLTVGGYAFFRQHQLWQEQLAVFEQQLDAAGICPGDLVPAIDLEHNSSGADGVVDPAAHNLRGRALVEAIAERYGSALVYISPGHWVELGRPDWVLEHEVWTAHWTRAEEPAWPKDWTMWQISAKHEHPGYPGRALDLNRARRLPLIE